MTNDVRYVGVDEYMYNETVINDKDLMYFKERQSIADIMNIILQDIDNLPPFSYLYFNESKQSKEFNSVVEANQKILEFEISEFRQKVEARLTKHKANVSDAVAIVEGMISDKTRKKSEKKSKSVVKCSLSGCQKNATTLCPTPLINYCMGRQFCPDHSKIHSDHSGEGSKLKKIRDNTSAGDNPAISEDLVLRPDIHCAVAECHETSISFCQGINKKCLGRKFCRVHGPLCKSHEFQTLKDVIISSTILDVGESDSDSESSVEHIMDLNAIAVRTDADIVVNDDKSNSNDSNNTSHVKVTNPSVIELEIEKSLTTALNDAARLYKLHPVESNYSFGKRSVKLGVSILLLYEQKWHLAKVGLSRKSNQGLHRLNFVHDTAVWLDVELKVSDHGLDKKWILMTTDT